MRAESGTTFRGVRLSTAVGSCALDTALVYPWPFAKRPLGGIHRGYAFEPCSLNPAYAHACGYVPSWTPPSDNYIVWAAHVAAPRQAVRHTCIRTWQKGFKSLRNLFCSSRGINIWSKVNLERRRVEKNHGIGGAKQEENNRVKSLTPFISPLLRKVFHTNFKCFCSPKIGCSPTWVNYR